MSLELFKNSGNFSLNSLSSFFDSKSLFKDRIDENYYIKERIDESCYKHLSGSESCFRPADYCSLTTWVSPSHAFLTLDCPKIFTKRWDEITWEVISKKNSYGFYPSKFVEKSTNYQTYSRPTELQMINVGVGFSASSTAAILMKPTSLFGSKTVITAGGSVTKKMQSAWKNFGYVLDDWEYEETCVEEKNCAQATFNISRTAGIAAETYIKKIKEACQRSDIKECYYKLLSHNCVDFVTDVVKAANLDANWFKHLTVEIPNYKFSEVWLYVALKAHVWLWGENRVLKM